MMLIFSFGNQGFGPCCCTDIGCLNLATIQIIRNSKVSNWCRECYHELVDDLSKLQPIKEG
jgi:hypothetical protein